MIMWKIAKVEYAAHVIAIRPFTQRNHSEQTIFDSNNECLYSET